MTTGLSDELRAKISDRTAVIGIIGMGYVGLPLALTFSEKGFRVLGFDVDPSKIEALRLGVSYIKHLDGERLKVARSSGRLEATAEFARLSEPDAILICVPTPLTPQREPDMSFVAGTARQIASHLRTGQLVVLESSTYPGTTDELVRELLEASGLKSGRDFFLAFSPEREDPGNRSFPTSTIPKVVGGIDPVSGDVAQALCDQVITKTVRVSSARTAEASKLVENIFRAVNIALVNELKMVFDRMGVDVWEVLDDRLLKSDALVSYHDPYIEQAPRMRSWPNLPPMASVSLTPEMLASSDAVVIVTDHSTVDYELVAQHAPVVIDTRGVFRNPRRNVLEALNRTTPCQHETNGSNDLIRVDTVAHGAVSAATS